MKNLVLATTLIIFAGCNLLSSDQTERFEVITLEAPDQSEWSQGNFMAYSESGLEASKLEEAKDFLRSVQTKDFQFEAAWFREGRGSCGNLAFVVQSQLIIQANETNIPDRIENIFEPIEGKPQIICPRIVYKIKPMNN